MNKADLSLHLDTATTFATVYRGDQPVASVRRKRVYGEADRKTWTVYGLDGAELFQTNLGSVTIRSRVAAILKAREAAKPAILTKPNTMAFAPLSEPANAEAYRTAYDAWEGQKATAKPYWNPYAAGADHKAVWNEAKAWEGKRAVVTLKDGTTRRGKVERVTTANAANGESGCAITIFDGYASSWCGCDFLALDELEAPQAIEPAPEAPKVAEALKVDRMAPEVAFAEVRRIRDELTALTGKLDHLDHGIARDLNAARDSLFGAWSKLRVARQEAA